MKAIILAAGRGLRMADFTCDKPKCLVELGGRSLLDWQLAALREAGIRDIVLVRGYKGECLDGDGYAVLDNPRWHETNMLSSLLCARKPLLKEECIVVYADILYHPEIISKLKTAGGDIAITYDRLWRGLWKERFADPLADAETFKINRDNRTVREIGKHPGSLDEIQGQYMGLLKFFPEGWKRAEAVLGRLSRKEIDKLDMTGFLGMLVKSGIDVYAVPVDGRWCEVDREGDFHLYSKKISEKAPKISAWNHDWRW